VELPFPPSEKKTPKPRSISPFLELGAYELLWIQPGASFKKIADTFRSKPSALSSDLVDIEEALKMAHKVLEHFKKKDIKKFGVHLHGDMEYPNRLRDAKNPVELLYYQGFWELIETKGVAVVGTRKPSSKAKLLGENLVKYLVKMGRTIVSGLAAGIDTVAHKTAMKLDSMTIGVLGTPLSENYPPANFSLQKTLAENFLIISQVPVCRYSKQYPPQNRLFFPERNITMSALTEATIIVEAGETSGTLIQARAALSQGRKLFILDHCYQDPGVTWPHRFEKEGAIRVKEFGQIVQAIHDASPNR